MSTSTKTGERLLPNPKTILWLLLIATAALLYACSGQSGAGAGIGADSGGGAPGGLVEKEGKLLENDLMIANAVDDQSQPDTAYDTVNNRYLTVWTDNRAPLTNGLDIYGAFVNGITNSI